MLLAPSQKPFDYRKPPRLSLGLAGFLLALAFLLFPADHERLSSLHETYRTRLLPVEWPLYGPYLMQTGRGADLPALEAAIMNGNTALLGSRIGNDRGFVANIRQGTNNYLEPEVAARWEADRQEYDNERNRLSYQVLGLDPQRFRPITFFSHAFTDANLNSVLLSVILLLLVGMTVEWSLGSGALLSAWLAGSAAGGLVYWLSHLGGVMPLTGSAHAVCGMLGLALREYRRNGSLRLLDSALTLGGWAIGLLVVIVIALQTWLHGPDWRWGLSLSAATVSGIAVNVLHHRWLEQKAQEDIESPAPETDNNEPFRQDLNHVMQKLSQMQFVAAEKNIRALLERYPEDKQLCEQLYHLVKLNPNNLEFEELAFALLTLPNRPAGNHISLRIYRDYVQRSQSFVALDDNTCLQLAMRFARIKAMRDAEEVFKRAQESNPKAPLLAKAAATLAQAFIDQHMEQRAVYYANLVKSSA